MRVKVMYGLAQEVVQIADRGINYPVESWSSCIVTREVSRLSNY